jgi:hypothetical protein
VMGSVGPDWRGDAGGRVVPTGTRPGSETVENLSHEHVGVSGDVAAEQPSGAATPKRTASLPEMPEEAPPPGLWSKLEAQLRREGIIR